jgi:ABC-type multidrug transport system fused ATPase/permease subunit
MIEHHVGEIIIDNVNIHTIGLHDLRQKITIIPQVFSYFVLKSFYNRVNLN